MQSNLNLAARGRNGLLTLLRAGWKFRCARQEDLGIGTNALSRVVRTKTAIQSRRKGQERIRR